MVCSKCKNEGVLTSVGTPSNLTFYYYCRVCKEEIELEEAPFKRSKKSEVSTIKNKNIDEEYLNKVRADFNYNFRKYVLSKFRK